MIQIVEGYQMQLTGLHHVTAVTGHAPENVAFYTNTLGMRLVKKTVNQDDVSAYHLFYGDRTGSAGTEMTFFDWPMAVRNRNGAGTIARTAFRVSGRAALEWWAQRLTDQGIAHSGLIEQSGRTQIHFADPEEQQLALVDDNGTPGGAPWEQSEVPVEHGIRGLDGVLLQVRDLGPTATVLQSVLGFRHDRDYLVDNDEHRRVAVFVTGQGGAGTEVHIEHGSHLPQGRLGRGGVHHVAFRVPNDDEHQAWQRLLTQRGMRATPVIDRFYFHSIYFREPNGILFELATDGPGFATDEEMEHLGERLALPPFLEPRRAEIEAGLRAL